MGALGKSRGSTYSHGGDRTADKSWWGDKSLGQSPSSWKFRESSGKAQTIPSSEEEVPRQKTRLCPSGKPLLSPREGLVPSVLPSVSFRCQAGAPLPRGCRLQSVVVLCLCMLLSEYGGSPFQPCREKKDAKPRCCSCAHRARIVPRYDIGSPIRHSQVWEARLSFSHVSAEPCPATISHFPQGISAPECRQGSVCLCMPRGLWLRPWWDYVVGAARHSIAEQWRDTVCLESGKPSLQKLMGWRCMGAKGNRRALNSNWPRVGSS